MHPFDPNDHPASATAGQVAAAERLSGAALPSWELEEWRYSPIEELELGRYTASVGTDGVLDPAKLDELKQRFPGPNLTVFVNGHLAHSEGVVSHSIETDDAVQRLGGTDDLFAAMNEVYQPATTTVSTKPGAAIFDDVVVVHLITEDDIAVFPRILIDAAENSALNVLEVFQSADHDALVIPHIEVRVGQAANVGYVAHQELGPRVWQVGSQISEVGQQATFRSSLSAFGGGYARMRSDCRLVGRGAHGDLDAVYYGDSEQVLDFRTFQDHLAPDTTSNLLFKGVVDDASRAIYTGLIRVAEEAPGTRAFQTNRNIKLGEDSWAESVPNLEIETNDVQCSHASTVGPIDDDQRFYLETRGVPSDVADQLIVSGFFDEVIVDLPVKSIEPAMRTAIEQKLAVAT